MSDLIVHEDGVVERDGVEVDFCDECGEELNNCWCDQQETDCHVVQQHWDGGRFNF